MEISSAILPSNCKYYPEQPQDVCFLPQSHYLVPGTKPSALHLTYEIAFCEIKVGPMGKKTMNSNWQERFFVLTPFRLLYFDAEGRTELKGCFNLATLVEHKLTIEAYFPEIVIKISIPQQNTFSSDKTLLTLQILNQKDYNEWLVALQTVVSSLAANPQQLSIFPPLAPAKLLENNQKIGKANINFWNTLTISPFELASYASHLDIIFFRSKSMFSGLHRFFMRSHYDHVGILLKDEAEKLYILQVVNQKGVIISPLENLIRSASDDYEEIGYRKLLSKPDLLPLQLLEQYVNSLIGKKYQLSLSKLFLNNDSELDHVNITDLTGEDEEVSGEVEEKPEKTYFCSELIADIYLKFGVLKEGKSNDFWPKDFEEDTLPLKNGFALSPLMQVDITPEEAEHSAQDQ